MFKGHNTQGGWRVAIYLVAAAATMRATVEHGCRRTVYIHKDLSEVCPSNGTPAFAFTTILLQPHQAPTRVVPTRRRDN